MQKNPCASYSIFVKVFADFLKKQRDQRLFTTYGRIRNIFFYLKLPIFEFSKSLFICFIKNYDLIGTVWACRGG